MIRCYAQIIETVLHIHNWMQVVEYFELWLARLFSICLAIIFDPNELKKVESSQSKLWTLLEIHLVFIIPSGWLFIKCNRLPTFSAMESTTLLLGCPFFKTEMGISLLILCTLENIREQNLLHTALVTTATFLWIRRILNWGYFLDLAMKCFSNFFQKSGWETSQLMAGVYPSIGGPAKACERKSTKVQKF